MTTTNQIDNTMSNINDIVTLLLNESKQSEVLGILKSTEKKLKSVENSLLRKERYLRRVAKKKRKLDLSASHVHLSSKTDITPSDLGMFLTVNHCRSSIGIAPIRDITYEQFDKHIHQTD